MFDPPYIEFDPWVFDTFAIVVPLLILAGVGLLLWRVRALHHKIRRRAKTSKRVFEDLSKKIRDVKKKDVNMQSHPGEYPHDKLEGLEKAIRDLRDIADNRGNPSPRIGGPSSFPPKSSGKRQESYSRSEDSSKEKSLEDKIAGLSDRTPGSSRKRRSHETPFADLYNDVVSEKKRVADFKQRYHPTNVDFANEAERQKNPNAAPAFQKKSSGKLWLIQHDGQAYVVPGPKTVLDSSDWHNGLEYVCGEKPSEEKYHQVHRLIEPAQIKKSGSGTWKVESIGEIKLKPYN